jgi:capsular exopolysaccharide synthesis family protein
MGYFFDAVRRKAEDSPVSTVVTEAAPQMTRPEPAAVAVASGEPAWVSVRRSPALVAGSHDHTDSLALLAREQYRVLRTKIMETLRVRDLRSILISSAASGEGKTTVSMNLALTIASLNELRVCLIDTDLRRPGVARLLDIEDGEGLDAYLLGRRDWRDGIRRVHDKLSVLPANPVPDRAGELITNRSMQRLTQELLLTHDLLILDGPPLTSVAEGQVLAGVVDAAILVVRSASSNYQAVCKAAQALGPKLLGAVLNSAPKIPHGEYFYKYIVQAQSSAEK